MEIRISNILLSLRHDLVPQLRFKDSRFLSDNHDATIYVLLPCPADVEPL